LTGDPEVTKKQQWPNLLVCSFLLAAGILLVNLAFVLFIPAESVRRILSDLTVPLCGVFIDPGKNPTLRKRTPVLDKTYPFPNHFSPDRALASR
jgi:hypothetical protein